MIFEIDMEEQIRCRNASQLQAQGTAGAYTWM
jgi:hypothetical protein